MNLLVFISSLSCGGAERVTANLISHWASKGWRITLVTLSTAEGDFYPVPSSVQRIGLSLLHESPNIFFGLINTIRRVLALRRVLYHVKPDIAISMMDKNNILMALASIGLKHSRFIGSERIHPPQYPMAHYWEWLRRYTYSRLDAVVALTSESAKWLQQHTLARNVLVIPNAAPYPLPSSVPHVPTPAQEQMPVARRLLAVGRLVYQKGFDLLIAAFQTLAPYFPDWHLYIVGDGPLRGMLAQQIEKAGLQGRVILVGKVGNLGDWYEAADLYVMSSRFEGFPNTLVEAMAYGVPAISFDCDTGPCDIIRHEVDGLLVSPGDVAALSQALSRLMKDAELRQRYAMRAIEARERFSIHKIAGMWEALFAELMSKKDEGAGVGDQ